MRVLWETMTEATNSVIMVDMEGGDGLEVATFSSLPCLTYMEDGTGPCWTWIFDQMGMSA